MIKANELKVGNYVYRVFDSPKSNEDLEIIKISGINALENTYVCSDDSIGSLEELKPIEITEELLLKYGFKLNRNCSTFCFIDIKEEITIWFDKELSEISIDIANGCQYIECEYFHQLQNLYFALTSKELVLSEA